MDSLKQLIKTYKRQFITLGMLIPLLVVGVFLALNPTVYRPKASGALLKLDPVTITKSSGEEFTVSLILDPAGKTVVATEAEIKYDPSVIEVSQDSFESPTLKIALSKIDRDKGTIKLGFGAFNNSSSLTSGVTTAATLVAIPFKAVGTGTTNITLGKSKVADSTGTNILENSFGQTVVQINGVAAGGVVASGLATLPVATYTLSPDSPTAQDTLTIKVSSKSGKVEGASIVVNTTPYKVKEEGNNTYSIQVTGLQTGKHIVQLVGGCKVASAQVTPDCEDAQIGFNPYQFTIGTNATPAPANQAIADETATLGDVIANWGRSGKGDVNGDGIVDSTDFAILYRGSSN